MIRTRRPLYLSLSVSHENGALDPEVTRGRLGWACTLAAGFVAAVGLLCAVVVARPNLFDPPDLDTCYTDAECEAAWLEAAADPCQLFECEGGTMR